MYFYSAMSTPKGVPLTTFGDMAASLWQADGVDGTSRQQATARKHQNDSESNAVLICVGTVTE